MRIVHLAHGCSFVTPDPAPALEKLTRMAQATAQASERRRIDAWHCQELVGRLRPSERVYGPVPLIDHVRDQCAWMGDSATQCCGQRTVPGKSWCARHYGKVLGRQMSEGAE